MTHPESVEDRAWQHGKDSQARERIPRKTTHRRLRLLQQARGFSQPIDSQLVNRQDYESPQVLVSDMSESSKWLKLISHPSQPQIELLGRQTRSNSPKTVISKVGGVGRNAARYAWTHSFWNQDVRNVYGGGLRLNLAAGRCSGLLWPEQGLEGEDTGLPDLGHGLCVDSLPTPNQESPQEIQPEGRVDGLLERRLPREAGNRAAQTSRSW